MKTDLHTLRGDNGDFFMGSGRLDGLLGSPLPLAYVVLLICQQGCADVNVNLQSYTIGKNDFLVLSEDSIAVINSKSDDFLCSYYLMNRSIAAEVAYELPNSLFLFLYRFPHFKPDSHFLDFLNAWEGLLSIISKEELQYTRQIIVNHFQNFFLWVSQRTVHMSASTRNDYSRQEAICWEFWELISAHCKQEREVAFYADLLHITPYYLSQLTRKFFNDSPKTLIDRQMVLEIKKQLTQSNESIQQIAHKFKFSDASYFGRYFKRITGVGLTEYRKLRS
ncbi:helix-turn-helix domain-containing protein [Vreelandella nigrificans]|nr:helix-turn-helix domain-containing protein [Halomonas nigrificans]